MNEIWEVWRPQGHIIYKPYVYSVIDYECTQMLITLSDNKLKPQSAFDNAHKDFQTGLTPK